MVLWHPNGKKNPDGSDQKEQRCPFCLTRRLKVYDYRLAEGIETKYGTYVFDLRCLNPNCKGECSSIVNIPVDGPVQMGRRSD